MHWHAKMKKIVLCSVQGSSALKCSLLLNGWIFITRSITAVQLNRLFFSVWVWWSTLHWWTFHFLMSVICIINNKDTIIYYILSKTDEVISVSFSKTIILVNVTLESVHLGGRKGKVKQVTPNFKCSGLGICISVRFCQSNFDKHWWNWAFKWNNLLCFTGNVNP